MAMLSAENIKIRALDLGFNLVGITRALPSPTLAAYKQWIAQGMQGNMGYLARPDRVIRREDLTVMVPEARTLIMVGLDYGQDIVPESILNDPTRGRIAMYAWGVDYHDVIQPQLEIFAEWLQSEASQQLNQRVYVDTGAILERSHGQQAGMGFIGKNTMLIHPRRGSNFFLGEIITTLEVDEYDTPHRQSMCGTCTRCLNACPTDAFPQPQVLDARRCISYHTIENKGWIERELRANFGNWVYGCDICQDVCPFQRFSPKFKQAPPTELHTIAPELTALLTLTEADFRARYIGSPILRIKRGRLVRNACIAAGNSGDDRFVPYLRNLLKDDAPLVRGHAAWALHQLDENAASATLRDHLAHESDSEVRDEISALLEDH
ncbi:MAG: tRNA epoxyqueuosine(34) reductase QueG [Anaerolineae bacterium]|nr:tRNA epoxyqueuosine(34) reductase QueG [Anaerolineae bacterium]